ncbi:methyltransferase TRM13-domain-containing protein [Fennellomyces sp. T-0311]|nr:methyltransferase TRM13-domain-containing protein [Fennellomyces sp. T-0311]
MPKEPHAKPSEIARREKKKAKVEEPAPPPPDKPQQCHFWVARKRRYCSLPAKLTNKFCGEHLNQENGNEKSKSDRRIPCPYDNSHTVFEKDLETHMQLRCNSRPREPEVFHSLNVNCSVPLSAEELEFQKNIYSHKQMHPQPWITRVQLAQLARHELDTLIEKVKNVQVPSIESSILTHDAAESKRQNVKQTKHLDQQSSLLGHMASAGMLDNKEACFIEFGAGKAELSAYVKAAVAEVNGEATYVLVDRKIVRNKVDNALMGLSTKRSTVQRVTIDIKDLDLSKVQALSDENGKRKKIVALSKHLCGSATDITLKCLMNYVESEKAAGNTSPISGIIIALCCHQLCRYEMYPNIPYLDQVGFSKLDFARLCKMSSWAICGQRTQAEQGEEDDHATVAQEAGDADLTTGHYSGLDHNDREKIGYRCKRAIDTGRVRYLEQYGFKVKLVYYVDSATSLENCALIAVPEEK